MQNAAVTRWRPSSCSKIRKFWKFINPTCNILFIFFEDNADNKINKLVWPLFQTYNLIQTLIPVNRYLIEFLNGE